MSSSLQSQTSANKTKVGKTSSLVLTLSGVLKDILLVFASIMLFRDPVSLLQAFGYSIALGGLVYYKLGGSKMKEWLGHGSLAWAELGQTRPILRKLLILGGVIVSFFLVIGSLGPRYAPESADKLYNGIGNIIGDKQI
jgi:hypothetical protein